MEKKTKAFFVPILKSEFDLTNFDVEFTNCQVNSFEESPEVG